MATRELLSPVQRLRLTELPDPMDERDLARYHTLSKEDLASIGKRRRPDTRMGFSVQLCYLRFPGRPLRTGERPPGNLLEYVAVQLGEDPAAFDEYARSRDTTRREHLREIVRSFGFRLFDAEARRELFGFLLPAAMGTDRGTALVEAALAEMRTRAIVVPAIGTVEELCWEVRREARGSVLRRLTERLSPEARVRLDGLLVVSPGESRAPLIWLREPPSAPGPKNFHKIVDRLGFVRSLGLPPNAGAGIHNNRLAQLAREGAKTTPQHLGRFDPDHRHATLVAYLTERAATLADEALDMHDRLVGEMLGKGEKVRDENFKKRGKAINEKVGLYAAVGNALIFARETGEDPYAARHRRLNEKPGPVVGPGRVVCPGLLTLPQRLDFLPVLLLGHHGAGEAGPMVRTLGGRLRALVFLALPPLVLRSPFGLLLLFGHRIRPSVACLSRMFLCRGRRVKHATRGPSPPTSPRLSRAVLGWLLRRLEALYALKDRLLTGRLAAVPRRTLLL